MRADFVQTVVLCAHANAFFASGSRDALEAARIHPILRRVNEWSFERSGRNDAQLAIMPGAFFSRMVREEVRALQAHFSPGPDGQPRAGFITDGDAGIEFWGATITPRGLEYGDDRPFRLTFAATKSGLVSLESPPTADVAFKALAAEYEAGPRTIGDFFPEFRAVRTGADDLVDLGPFPDDDLWPVALDGRTAVKADLAIRTLRFLESAIWRQEIGLRPEAGSVAESLRNAACNLLISATALASFPQRRAEIAAA